MNKMDKLKMQTKDYTEENAKKLMELFPNIVTESTDINGNVIRAIDKDKLEQEINATVVGGSQQRYEFTWPDKKKAQIAARTSIKKTLRPCREESVNFDTTENLYIEGDNLEVLKLLQETYLGKIKMIYIDPPYNTGHDFVYDDKFDIDDPEYQQNNGQRDEEGNRLFQNTETNGRFHTDWLNMMYPRLKLAKNLLTDDGVIFISIDDNEVRNLKILCDEIFGEQNFVGTYLKQSKVGGGSDSKFIVKEHEYCIVYVRAINCAEEMYVQHSDEYLKRYKEQDEKGKFFWDTFARPGLKNPIYYDIIAPDNTVLHNGWIHSKSRFEEEVKNGEVRIIKKGDGNWSVQFKQYLNIDGKKPRSFTTDFGGSIEGKNDLISLFENDKIFSYPKSVKFVSTLLQTIQNSKSAIVLDFFSGSATTAHAVMQLNAEDGGKRKFIMVQLPEKCDEKSEAFKAGYKNICEIGKERIRRAGKKIVEGLTPQSAAPTAPLDSGALPSLTREGGPLAVEGLDIGFRVLKVDESNMEDVFYTPNKVEQVNINMFAENIKPDRTPMDLLFQVMLDLGVELSSKIEVKEVKDKLIYSVNNNYLVACFDDALDDEVITAIAKLQPVYFVTRDSSIATDSVFTNFEQIFMTYSKDTIRKVL